MITSKVLSTTLVHSYILELHNRNISRSWRKGRSLCCTGGFRNDFERRRFQVSSDLGRRCSTWVVLRSFNRDDHSDMTIRRHRSTASTKPTNTDSLLIMEYCSCSFMHGYTHICIFIYLFIASFIK